MAFALSPGVTVVEKDFTSIVPAASSSTGAFAGAFQWGPVLDPITVSSENELVRLFGKPKDGNINSFFTAANFLAYTNNLIVARADSSNQKNAVSTPTGVVSATFVISNAGTGYLGIPTVAIAAPSDIDGTQATATAVISGAGITSIAVGTPGSGYTTTAPTVVIAAPDKVGGVQAVAHATINAGVVATVVIDTAGSGYSVAPVVTFTGGDGTSAATGTVVIGGSTVTGITIVNAGSGYTTTPAVTFASGTGSNAAATAALILGAGTKIKNLDDYETNFVNGAGIVGEFVAKYPGTLGNSLKVSMADAATYAAWTYKAEFDSAPSTSTYVSEHSGSNDELHIIVIDEKGAFTGTSGAILEKFAYVSKASDSKKFDGSNNYYKEVLNRSSQYIWWTDHTSAVTGTTAWGTESINASFKSLTAFVTRSLTGGVDDLDSTLGQLMSAWSLFADDSRYDISLLPVGKAQSALAIHVIGIAETRKDCVVFISPENVSTHDIITGTGSVAVDAINAYRNALPSSSYAVLDSGYKYQYDRYNDKYRYVPLNGDIAGLCARTDLTNDAWWSPGGLNRGQIKNLVKLAFNPSKTDRDNLYKNAVNPVVSFPGQGTVLFGDKTLLAKPSAFDRINVRRLFIILEKSISKAAQYQLFEFNDTFTRAQFVNMVEPFLRDVKGRRGVTDYVIKCDSINNTGEVIDRNEFVGDIFVKPARSINFITLNFVAARTGINFTEIGG